MRLRNLLLGAAGTAGGVALANRLLRAPPADPPLGREQSTYRWRGFDVAYTDAGDPDDPDILLLHGVNAAGSSHEFVNVVGDLADEYHVIAPDLPGFGGSDRPSLLYSGSLYVAFVREFLRDIVDEEPTIVASSLSASYAAVAAEQEPVGELVLVCPTATAIPGRRVWLRSLLRSPVVGEGLFNLVVSKPSIRKNLADHGFADPDNVSDEWIAYDWETAHQPGSRYAPASFVSGFLNLDVDLVAVLADVDVPTTIIWGSEARMPDPGTGRDLADEIGAAFHVIEGADLLPHAERPEAFLEALEAKTIPT
ncbi:alpha/beta fold hydrolase [Halorarius litoreus]|uniref:alpha/beta fold hydrolase n=1 Tax=Halorarius litoreus TaxID=2962676 RepID=UPI0020CD71DA|nr:alpha/beta hydrolase [Halorarius litoreus]